MAEWPFTDLFFESDVTALGGAGERPDADFGPLEAALTNGPKHVGNSHQRENDYEEHDENEFGSDQGANKIKLQDEKRGSKGQESLSHSRFSDHILPKILKLG